MSDDRGVVKGGMVRGNQRAIQGGQELGCERLAVQVGFVVMPHA